MEIKLGDTVQVDFGKFITGHNVGEHIDVAMSQHFYEEAGMKAYRGKVVRIKTHLGLGLIPLEKPIYYVSLSLFPEICMKTLHVKKVIRC